ncbi:DUF3078 domain-containing protein [Flavisolibacter tropicus]|uniref:DUF3078 domain-containing protein n=1 Tax=Flavisolibacter tropicus TaxID=1492898 RepID=A0A172TY58_9BACT|nr:DUF3078 domain-containing protein [Flavisolibacter tropicus]ANE51713.1 hypothetical protein SY85_15610 [Flavisolibacter tropicus]
MKKMLLLCCLLYAGLLMAQDTTVRDLRKQTERTIKKDSADTTNWVWKTGGLYTLTVSQGSLSNWAAGGDDFTLSLNTILSLFAFYRKDRHNWDNTLDFAYGFVRTTSTGSRKNDDRLDLLSKYGYAIAPKWNIATLFNFRTQSFKGYQFHSDNTKTLISNFLSPGYVLFSIGMDYRPNQWLSVYLSPITTRWVIVKDDSLSQKGLYGVPAGKHSHNEIGAFVTASFLKDLAKNITYKGRLDLFSNYKHNPQNIDITMTNILAIKLWKSLALTWNVDIVYDDDTRIFGPNGTSARTQFKSLVGVGLALRF